MPVGERGPVGGEIDVHELDITETGQLRLGIDQAVPERIDHDLAGIVQRRHGLGCLRATHGQATRHRDFAELRRVFQQLLADDVDVLLKQPVQRLGLVLQ